METETLTQQQIDTLAFDACLAIGTSPENTRALAVATAAPKPSGGVKRTGVAVNKATLSKTGDVIASGK